MLLRWTGSLHSHPEIRVKPDPKNQPVTLLVEQRWERFLRERHRLSEYVRALMRDPVDAEDLFQEVGLAVMRHPHGPDAPERFAAWCRGIARNLAHERWRAQKRERSAATEEIAALVDRAYDEADLRVDEWEQRRAALASCIERLGRADRELLQKRYAGAAAEALGKKMGLTAEAVRMRIMRLRQALSRCIKGRLAGETSS